MLLTTTDTLEGIKIERYFGVVTSMSIQGASFAKDFFARVRNFTGGRVLSYEKEYKEAKMTTMEELAEKARKIGANAVIGIRFDHEVVVIGSGAMLMMTVQGTAVRTEEAEAVS